MSAGETIIVGLVVVAATVCAILSVFSSEALAGVFGTVLGYFGKSAVEAKRAA